MKSIVDSLYFEINTRVEACARRRVSWFVNCVTMSFAIRSYTHIRGGTIVIPHYGSSIPAIALGRPRVRAVGNFLTSLIG